MSAQKYLQNVLILVIFSSMLSDLVLTYILYDEDEVKWGVAKSRCESQGQRLAVLDEAYKLQVLEALGM